MSLINKQTQMIKQPLDYQKRHRTDCCCTIVGILFTVIMMVSLILMYRSENMYKTSIPSDSEGKVCGIDWPKYTLIYFTNPNDISQRVCVSKCPVSGDRSLDCVVAGNIGCKFNSIPGFEVQYYDTTLVSDSNGNICMPKDETLKKNIIQKAKLQQRQLFFKSFDVLVLSIVGSIGLAILITIIVQCGFKYTPQFVIFMSLLTTLLLAVLLFLYKTQNKNIKIIICVILAILFITSIITFCFDRESVKISSVYLKESARFSSQSKIGWIYIPLFMLVFVGFIGIMLLQYRGIWTFGKPKFDAHKSLYYEVSGSVNYVLMVIWLIQLIWGCSFVKESFNFVISSHTVYWVLKGGYILCLTECCGSIDILKCLLFKHFGSVVASSFVNGFFFLPDFLFDYLRLIVSCCCNNLDCLSCLDLVRTDTLSYVYLTGNSFCNSARYCQYISNESMSVDKNQSSMRIYRINAHLFVASAISIAALYIKGQVQPYIILAIFILCIFSPTFLLSYHSDAADAIQMIFLLQEEFSKRSDQSRSKRTTSLSSKAHQQNYITEVRQGKFLKQTAKQIAEIRTEQWGKLSENSK